MHAMMQLYGEIRIEQKNEIVEKLRKLIGFSDSEVSEELKQLGERVIQRFSELYFIDDMDIRVGYALSYKAKKKDGKLIFAECHKVKIPYDAYLPYDFVIVFYEPNIAYFTPNQKKILMLHELKHIGLSERGLCLVPHDIEDFESILRSFGLNWNDYDEDVIDILAGGEDDQREKRVTKGHNLEAQRKAKGNRRTPCKSRRSTAKN